MKQIILFLFCIMPLLSNGQSDARNQGAGLLAHFSYAVQLPGGDLSDRFGNNFSAGAGLDYLTEKSNWFFGLEGHYMFGSQVDEDIFRHLRTTDGILIGNDRSPAEIQLRQRGFLLEGHVGKLISLTEKNPRAGLKLSLGVGFLQHKIRIQDDPLRVVPQLEGDYEAGYDRLTYGLMLRQFVGYQQLALDKRLNFYGGLEFIQGFTKNQRSLNFDTQQRESGNRLDLSLGFRVGLILPFYMGFGEEIYY